LTRYCKATEVLTYNDLIIIQEYTQARGDYGEVDNGTWATYKSVWAEVVDGTGVEDFQSDMDIYSDIKTFKIHSPDASSVTTKMRISYDSRFFEIISMKREGRLFTTLTAIAFDDE